MSVYWEFLDPLNLNLPERVMAFMEILWTAKLSAKIVDGDLFNYKGLTMPEISQRMTELLDLDGRVPVLHEYNVANALGFAYCMKGDGHIDLTESGLWFISDGVSGLLE